jgi:glycosyltransferase involved in cell wall biosynthesis
MSNVIHPACIAQIIPRLDTGGAERATLEMADAITRAGGRAIVLSEGGRLAGEIERVGGEVISFPAATKNPAKIIANASRLARFVRERGVDLLHARSRAPAWSALFAAHMTGTAFVTTYHGAYSNNGPLKPFYNSVMARGQLVIANSEFTGRLIQQRHGVAVERIRVIRRGVDLVTFDPAHVSEERITKLRESWGVASPDKIVLQAARLTAWKGQHDVIEAAKRVFGSDRGKNVVFVLAGDAQGRETYVSSLKRQIAEHGSEGKVQLVGHCNDMPAAFAAAHVTVIASTEPEAFGRTSAEAQAMGCPVVVTRQGASPETLLTAARHGAEQATGWVVPVSAPKALANAIAEALTLTGRERREMSARARAHIVETFSAERMKRDTLAVYDECLRSALVAAFDAANRVGAKS